MIPIIPSSASALILPESMCCALWPDCECLDREPEEDADLEFRSMIDWLDWHTKNAIKDNK